MQEFQSYLAFYVEFLCSYVSVYRKYMHLFMLIVQFSISVKAKVAIY